MKCRGGKSQRREEKRREENRKEERRKKKEDQKESLRRKKIQVPEKVGKSRNTVFFPMICGSGGSKSRLAKAAGAEAAGQMRDEKLHAARSTFRNQNVQDRTTFGSCDVEKVHTVVARSTFRTQNLQNTTCSDHFWAFRCFALQAQGIVDLVKSEQNVRVL